MNLDNLKQQAELNKKSSKKLLQKIKKKKPRHLDEVFHTAHDEVFEYTNCLNCANCCKTTSPLFIQKDIDRIAKHLRLSPTQFIEQYLKIDEDGDYVFTSSPCPFLGADNYCSIYEVRPKACSEYPHTNRKSMHQIMNLTLRNTSVCPAVLDIMEKVKERLF